MATSREGLVVEGEQVWPVPSLGRDGPGSASAALFVDRARAVAPDVDVASDPAVVEVCARLDGIPLAIELAAARVRSMSPSQIRDRLDARFRLLTGGSRRTLKRHQTLRHTVRWSFDLLTAPDRLLLQRLAVFAGGWTLPAAEVVGAGGDVDATGVVDLLDSLVRKSLVSIDRTGSEVRYALLETIREFAEEQLIAGGGIEAVRSAHSRYYAGVARDIYARWASPDQATAYRDLDRELANLRVAFRWALDHDDLDDAIDLGRLGWIGQYSLRLEPLPWAEETIEPARRTCSRRLPHVLVAASFCGFVGRVTDAVRFASEALALERDPRFDSAPHGFASISLAVAHLYSGRVDEAVRTSADGARHETDHTLRNNRIFWAWLATLSANADTRTSAVHSAADTLDLALATKIPSQMALGLYAYARALADRDPAEAIRAERQGREIARSTNNVFLCHAIEQHLAGLEAQHGELDTALTMFDEVIGRFFEAGSFTELAATIGCLAVLYERVDQPDVAATFYGAGGATLRTMPYIDGLDDALGRLRSRLGTRFDELVAAGAALDRRQAVNYAHTEIANTIATRPNDS